MLRAHAPRWPCPEVSSGHFRQAPQASRPLLGARQERYHVPKAPGRWCCACGQENLTAEASCRACGAQRHPRAAAQGRVERLRARAERGVLRAADVAAAHVEGSKLGPELKGWEEPAPRHHRDMEARP